MLALVMTVGICAIGSTADEKPAVRTSPEVSKLEECQKKLAAVEAENATIKAEYEKLAIKANGLLAKVGDQAKVITLLEIEVGRLTDAETARKGK
jgi:hypothetical protein